MPEDKFDPSIRERLNTLVNIARYHNTPLVQQAIESGRYGTFNLYQVQETLISTLREEYPLLGRDLNLTTGYNPETFRSLIDQLRELTTANRRPLVDVLSEAVTTNNPELLRHFPVIPPTPQKPEPIQRSSPPPPSAVTSEPSSSSSSKAESTTRPETIDATRTTRHFRPDSERVTRVQEEVKQPSRDEEPEPIQQPQEQQQSREEEPPPPPQAPSQPQNAPSQPGRGGWRDAFKKRAQEIAPQAPKIAQMKAAASGGSTSTGGLGNALNNYLNAKSGLQAGRWLANRFGLQGLTSGLDKLLGLEGALGRGLAGLGRAGLQGLARGAANLLPRLGAQAAFTAGRAALSALAFNPITWAAALALSPFIILALAYWWDTTYNQNIQCNQPGEMTVTKRLENGQPNQNQLQNGEEIKFYIEVTYTWLCNTKTLDTVTVTDKIPEGTIYDKDNPTAQSATSDGKDGPLGVYDETTDTITWTVNNVHANDPVGFYFSVKPKDETKDVWITNQATVTYNIEDLNLPSPSITGGDIPPGGDEAPNQNDCSGAYKGLLNSPLGNFGDPSCNFKKNDLAALVKQLDPVDADYWFLTVIRKESSYNPNAYNGGSTSGAGAYGLFQMNPTGRGNNEFDRGDVPWQKQTSNAINYKNGLSQRGKTWCYWEAASDRWTSACRLP